MLRKRREKLWRILSDVSFFCIKRNELMLLLGFFCKYYLFFHLFHIILFIYLFNSLFYFIFYEITVFFKFNKKNHINIATGDSKPSVKKGDICKENSVQINVMAKHNHFILKNFHQS